MDGLNKAWLNELAAPGDFWMSSSFFFFLFFFFFFFSRWFFGHCFCFGRDSSFWGWFGQRHTGQARATGSKCDFQDFFCGFFFLLFFVLCVQTETYLRSTEEESAAQRSMAHILQLEVDRIRFSLTSYLKVRLRKIEKHARFIDNTPELHIRLSTAELNHLKVWKRAEKKRELTFVSCAFVSCSHISILPVSFSSINLWARLIFLLRQMPSIYFVVSIARFSYRFVIGLQWS